MKQFLHARFRTPVIRALGIVGMSLALSAPHALPAKADDNSAKTILRTMADYVGSQNDLSLKYDSDIEVITPSLEKIQFSASGDVVLSRPNKVRVSRTGGYADIGLVFDGNTATILDKGKKTYAQLQAPGDLDQLVDRLRTNYMVEMPGADLLLSKVYEELVDGVLEAKHIGRGVVDGVECEHLAFRNQDTDWQMWVEVGDRPIPRKYVITSKTLAGGPQYTLRIRDWKTEKADPNAFVFTAPEDARQVDVKALADIDEVPAGTVAGGRK